MGGLGTQRPLCSTMWLSGGRGLRALVLESSASGPFCNDNLDPTRKRKGGGLCGETYTVVGDEPPEKPSPSGTSQPPGAVLPKDRN